MTAQESQAAAAVQQKDPVATLLPLDHPPLLDSRDLQTVSLSAPMVILKEDYDQLHQSESSTATPETLELTTDTEAEKDLHLEKRFVELDGLNPNNLMAPVRHGSGILITDENNRQVYIPDEVNVYQQKKTLAQGMMDLALLSANANQLRYVLETFTVHPYKWTSLMLIFASLIFQVAVGIGLLMNSQYNVTKADHMTKANKVNNYTVIGIFLVTVINVFIASFGVADLEDVNEDNE